MTNRSNGAKPASLNEDEQPAAPRWLLFATDLLVVPAELCVLLMMLHIMTDILFRAVANVGLEGTVESVTHWYMVALAFLPVASLEAREQHLRVTLLADRLSGVPKRYLLFFSDAVTAICCAALAWLTLGQAQQATQLGEYIELTYWALPIWPVRWLFPAGFAAMAFTAVVIAIGRFTTATTKNSSRL